MSLFGNLIGSKKENPQVRIYKLGEKVRHKRIADVIKGALTQNKIEVEKLKRSRKL